MGELDLETFIDGPDDVANQNSAGDIADDNVEEIQAEETEVATAETEPVVETEETTEEPVQDDTIVNTLIPEKPQQRVPVAEVAKLRQKNRDLKAANAKLQETNTQPPGEIGEIDEDDVVTGKEAKAIASRAVENALAAQKQETDDQNVETYTNKTVVKMTEQARAENKDFDLVSEQMSVLNIRVTEDELKECREADNHVIALYEIGKKKIAKARKALGMSEIKETTSEPAKKTETAEDEDEQTAEDAFDEMFAE